MSQTAALLGDELSVAEPSWLGRSVPCGVTELGTASGEVASEVSDDVAPQAANSSGASSASRAAVFVISVLTMSARLFVGADDARW